ncbi:hypothetical protein M407DRAFT_246617 [Tulasnella calospora MUT 4182]|uniref:Uncharacterized protein n=1 Tax=Tulasnella calospora MUT 4182 TaxID=1051891 RepID=A0A0C3Q4S7_9AGAM|nr:hypothetical protein M407DRAFT_246617 [Tulasnella calospora MUT 4182]
MPIINCRLSIVDCRSSVLSIVGCRLSVVVAGRDTNGAPYASADATANVETLRRPNPSSDHANASPARNPDWAGASGRLAGRGGRTWCIDDIRPRNPKPSV